MQLSSLLIAFLRLTLAAGLLLIPAWWAAGRIQKDGARSIFRLLCAIGLALVGYVAGVNLLARLLGRSIAAALIYLVLNAIAGAFLWRRRPASEFRPICLLSSWRAWAGPVVIACALSLPQWFLAVSSNYWDEATTSAIHLTAPNQFAEGVFPPRHNALPDVSIKYHYAFTILSGSVKWLLGVSANVSIDLVSTGLWLFIFLFIYFWFRELEFDALAAGWGAFSTLFGGGLAWLYLRRIESYDGIEKVPPASSLTHHYDAAKNWLSNLIGAAMVPSQHLRNADRSVSSLTWDIAAQFQQHAVSLGIAMALVALYLFTTWRRRADLRGPLLAANIVVFSATFLGHAVFGTVAAVAAGVCLLLEWLPRPTRKGFGEAAAFTASVTALAVLHGGMLSRGAQYGGGGFLTMRRVLGYSEGGLGGFLNWNIASFGLPLVLALLALCLRHRDRRDPKAAERNILFTALTVFGVFSYIVPQVAFYSSDSYGVEQYTEVSKFFFSARFALALLSTFGVAYLRSARKWWIVIPCFAAAAISPLVYCYANSVDPKGKWLGFYHTPYYPNSIEEQMGRALGRLKKTNHDVYFDASADERRSGYLSEMLIFGGSVFTMTPSAYERTGIGFRLGQEVVARRFEQNSRMARLLPGIAEAVSCAWYYTRPLPDMALAPVIVRSRFAKLVAEGYFSRKFAAGIRELYAIEKPTANLDSGIERYWSPYIVAQTKADCDGDGKGDLIFYDLAAKKILCGRTVIDLPEESRGEFVNLYVGLFPGESKSTFHLGRMKDTYFRLGKSINDVIEQNSWVWKYRDSRNPQWQPEYERWFWNLDIPLVADLDHDGYASHLAYRPSTGEWLLAPDFRLPGPKVDMKLLPVPFAGRFLEGSKGDLGLWSLMDGMVTLKTIATGKTVSFRWGGTYGFILVPGDYDGDGRDELGIYNQNEFTWYWGLVPGGALSHAKFGTKTGIPMPWDYNHDGRLDLAYWEPSQSKIYVSFDSGRSVGRVVPVPSHSIPAFVNMY